MHPLLNIAISAARQAGEIITRHLDQLDHIKITEKQRNDYFTEVDIKAEQAIIQAIHKAYPDHGIIAEESGVVRDNADVVWVIDPLDGTRNYINGLPIYAVSIAVRTKNRIEHAVTFDPSRHEFFTASRGQGARLNDRRIRVSKQTQLQAAMLGTGLPSAAPLASQALTAFTAMNAECASIRRLGSTTLSLAYVASGRLDGFWELAAPLWDIAAGSLLVQEAGGLVSDLNGSEDFLRHGNIVAGSPKILKNFLQTLNGVKN